MAAPKRRRCLLDLGTALQEPQKDLFMAKVRITVSALPEVVADLRVDLTRQFAIQKLVDLLDYLVAGHVVALVLADHGSPVVLTVLKA
jgi:hypothetical protein